MTLAAFVGRLAVVAFFCVVFQQALCAAEVPRESEGFFDAHCISCHDSAERAGELDLTSLKFDPNDTGSFATWVKVFDRVAEGKMPPKDADQPESAVRSAFTSSLAESLASVQRARIALNGRTTRRRLNRHEYENVMRDLLQTPWLQLKNMLPEDPEAYHYNKSGEALDMSHLQMTRDLEAAEFALREVMAKQILRPEPNVNRYYAREQRSFLRHMYKYTNEQERCVIPVLDYDVEFGIFENKQPKTVGESDPERREREGFVEIASQYESYSMWFDSFKAPVPGRYKLRLKTFTAWIGPSSLEFIEPGMQGVEDRWWIPDLGTVSKGRRTESVSVYADSLPSNYRLIGRFEAQREI